MVELCQKCPSKLPIAISKMDNGVKKALAFRLRMVLDSHVSSMQLILRNLSWNRVLTYTQKMKVVRHNRKIINAYRIVINDLERSYRHGDTGRTPTFYDDEYEFGYTKQKGEAMNSLPAENPKPKK